MERVQHAPLLYWLCPWKMVSAPFLHACEGLAGHSLPSSVWTFLHVLPASQLINPLPPPALRCVCVLTPASANLPTLWVMWLPCSAVACSQAGIPADEIRVDPRPVTPRLLQRSHLLSRGAAKAAVAALRAARLLDEVWGVRQCLPACMDKVVGRVCK